MPWLRSVFGSDGSPIVQYVVIFAVIFTALAAIVFVVRRLTGRGLALPGRANGRGRQPRLGIVDVYELDRARQLILLRRDNVEHLLLVGGPNDVVVERNIQRGQRPPPEAGLRPEPATGSLPEPPSDPPAGADRLPAPPPSLPDSASRRPEPPAADFEMPVVVPAAVPGSGKAPPVTLPLDAGLLGGDEPGQDLPVPTRAPLSAVRPTAPPPQPAAPAREPFSARRILRRTAPPALDAGAGPASERVAGDAPSEVRPDPSPAAAPPPPPRSAERRAIDPAVLSDMARQLQAALARPASAVTPPPAPVSPEPAREPPAVDPVAAAMAGAPGPAAAGDASHPAETRAASAPPQPPPVRRAEATGGPEVASPPPRDGRPPVASAPPRSPAPEPAPKTAGNPFSVEEIEAEFARLLGRPLDKRG